MSSIGEIPSGLPAASAASEPSWVRKGSPELQREYALAVEFERMLTEQMAGAMTKGTGLSGEQEGEGEGFAGAGSSVLGSMLPGALASGVTSGGGLGIATELTRELAGRLGAPTSTTPGSQATAIASSGGVRAAGGGDAQT
jgi:Rod binding domain-containing protein